MSGTVIVIGGGIIGTACAHYLRRAGWDVTIVERGGFGQGCSHANCGFVVPSHVLPLAEPGAVREAFKALFRRNASFAIRWRFDPALWQWFFRFALRCNRQTMLADGHACQALLRSSRSLYDDLMKDPGLECEWQTRGLLFVYQTSAAMEHYAATDRLLLEHFQLAAERYDGDELVKREPALKPGLAGAWHYTGDAHLRPDRLLSSWRSRLEAAGVTIREQCDMRGFIREANRAVAVQTSAGSFSADAFVVAAGALTPLLSKQLGCRIPIQPGKGYSITMPRPTRCPVYPMLFPEHRVGVTPMASGYRLGSTMEFAGYDSTIDRRRLQILRDGAAPYLHEPYCEPVEEEWFGWRPMTYDGKPIIDRSPIASNVWIAAGHNMLGVSMAPATGKLVAELVSGAEPHVDPSPYAVARFS